MKIALSKSFLRGLFLFLSTGCASVSSISVTQIPADRSKKVKTSVSKFVFLAFNFDNDYIDPIVSNLKSKCPNGKIQGILTKHEVKNYFIFFDNTVTATGYCVGG
jgi:hypothetical protein